MNYLAHVYLSFGESELMVGNLIADFVKGRKKLESYPEAIQRGIRLHRAIDEFSDMHPLVKKGIERLKPVHQRYASVVVDIYYDYFLAINWGHYSTDSLETFADKSYQQLKDFIHLLPPLMQWRFDQMIQDNWLAGYQYEERMELVFERLQHRVQFEANLGQALEGLRQHKTAFNEEFNLFFPQLISFSKRWLDTGDLK